MTLTIKKLKSVLAYDSEEIKFLSISERCIIHQNIILLEKGKELEFTPEFKMKLTNKLKEIKKNGWKYIPQKWMDVNGVLIKTKVN